MKDRIPLDWIGSSKRDLLALPKEIQRMFGYSLNIAQQGEKDDDTKPLKGFGGCSVLEIVKNDADGTYRAVYTVKFKDILYVLHVFQKKSKKKIKTPQQDIELIKSRLIDAKRMHEEWEAKRKVLKK